jgi:hypothetical protein
MNVAGLIIVFETNLIVVVEAVTTVKLALLIKLLVAHKTPLVQHLTDCSDDKLSGQVAVGIMGSEPVNADYCYENFSNHGVLLCCG